MTSQAVSAEGCLAAVCAHLSTSNVRDENLPVWLDVLRGVIPDCDGCPSSMARLKTAAAALVDAKSRRAQGRAFARLQFEAGQYFEMAAAARFEAWKQAKAGGRQP